MRFTPSFNRTNVELKLLGVLEVNESTFSFNRTNVELKHFFESSGNKRNFSFNRTNVELKHQGSVGRLWEHRLLIVPMWN